MTNTKTMHEIIALIEAGHTGTAVARLRAMTDTAPQAAAWQWRSRIKGGAWDAWENGRYGQEIPPFLDIEEREITPATPSALSAAVAYERAAEAVRKRGQSEMDVKLLGATTQAFYEAYDIIRALSTEIPATDLLAEAARVLLASGAFEISDCGCMGPQDGEPLCPCGMKSAMAKRLRELAGKGE